MLEAKQISKYISKRCILQGIDLMVEEGEMLTILGPNGAGKSTLLKILCLLEKASSGSYYINGHNVFENPKKMRNLVGVLSHHSYLYENLTVYENLEFYGQIYGLKDIKNRVTEMIKKLELELVLHEPVSSLSRGMKQRAAFTRAILHRPKFLVLDEPQTGLDQQAQGILYEILLDMKKQGVGLIVVTHIFDEFLNKTNKLLILDKGQQLFYGPSPHDYQEVQTIYKSCVQEKKK